MSLEDMPAATADKMNAYNALSLQGADVLPRRASGFKRDGHAERVLP
jgi:hypothetical protein